MAFTYRTSCLPSAWRRSSCTWTRRASAAGLHKGDILVAINGRRFTGTAVFWEEIVKAIPGSTLAVTVRSPGASPQEHTVRMPVTQIIAGFHKDSYGCIGVVMPAFCIALGFWVVLVRPNDPSAWLLLGLLLSFTQAPLSAPAAFCKLGARNPQARRRLQKCPESGLAHFHVSVWLFLPGAASLFPAAGPHGGRWVALDCNCPGGPLRTRVTVVVGRSAHKLFRWVSQSIALLHHV
jgi:hypothetical protein